MEKDFIGTAVPSDPHLREAVTMRATWLGRVPFARALALQEQIFYGKRLAPTPADEPEDTVFFLEHTPVYTLGFGLKSPERFVRDWGEFKRLEDSGGVEVYATSRGGSITYHGPGQLVCYPILNIGRWDVRRYMESLQRVVALTLGRLGVECFERQWGTWVRADGSEKKICSYGVAVRRGRRGARITMHGFAFNVTTELHYFDQIFPCGIVEPSPMVNLSDILRPAPSLEQLARMMAEEFARVFGTRTVFVKPETLGIYLDRKPPWLRVPKAPSPRTAAVARLVRGLRLNTVCEDARCPNIDDCWSAGDVTVMILGGVCTRRCGFCSVPTGRPAPPDGDEPERVASAAAAMPHNHVVITSVDRDDLPDGGSAHWARTIRAVREACPHKTVEALVPDFKGDPAALERVLEARPHVFAHNLETVRRLHRRVRPQSSYERALEVLAAASEHRPRPVVKSNLMVGLGESVPEIAEALEDLRAREWT